MYLILPEDLPLGQDILHFEFHPQKGWDEKIGAPESVRMRINGIAVT
ncbi:hypothetical protein [Membranihabitans maritimus]|nr:hypothetical protein [Membranihabitans maritimus]